MVQYSEHRSPLGRLLLRDARWRRRAGVASAYSVINKLFDIAPELLIGAAVDVVVQREESFLASLGVGSLRVQLLVLGGLTVLIWAGESVFQYLYQVAWRNLAQAVQHSIRAQVYDHVQHLTSAELERRRQGELQTILTEDVNQLERFLNEGLNNIIQVLTSTAAVGVVFFLLAPQVAFFAMLPIPLIIAVAFWFQRGLAQRYAVVRDVAGRLGARLTAQLHGIATIKAYTAQSRALDALQADSRAYESSNRRAITLSSAFVPLIRMAVLLGFVVTLVFGGFLTLDGELAVGAYSVLVFLTQRLLWPFTSLGDTVDLYQRSMASIVRLLDVLALEREEDVAAAATGPKPTDAVYAGDIVFDDVSFSYDGRRPILNRINLSIQGKSFVGLVGATGSGKTTLMKLLMRFYSVEQGSIRLGGRDLASLQLEPLRQRIGWVGQEVFLFHGTLHDNIALGQPRATRAEVIEAAQVAELHQFVISLEAGYDTVVGDFGATLSGGQRQRLSIARAVLKNPRILILDEATSAIDNETEAAIQRSLARVAKDRTVIAVAHRLSTIRHAREIFVLDDGQVVEQGTHDQLVAADGRYTRLWSTQIGDREA